jgi:hypothetical protein
MRGSNATTLTRLNRLWKEVGFDRIRSATRKGSDPAEAGAQLGELGVATAEILDPRVEIDNSTFAPGIVEGDHWNGVDGWLGAAWYEAWDNLEWESSSYEAVGDDVLVDVAAKGIGRTSGVPVELRYTQVWTFREGRVIRLRSYESRAAALRGHEDAPR